MTPTVVFTDTKSHVPVPEVRFRKQSYVVVFSHKILLFIFLNYPAMGKSIGGADFTVWTRSSCEILVCGTCGK
jgi:hypothetical protein